MPRHLRRRHETLIPVSLRLLDESGRHRIAEPMLGIAIEVSGYDMLVSVMGRAGRPLSLRLARNQKMVVSFLATELHEKVESLVCDLHSVAPISGQPDAWQARLILPVLMPDLAEEIVTALQRYGRQRRRMIGAWPAAALVTSAAIVAWTISAWSGTRAVQAETRKAERLQGQLAFSNQTIDQLTKQLEEADLRVEQQRQTLADAERARAALADLEAQQSELQQRLDRAEADTPLETIAKVQMQGVSLTDFRTMRSIRGAATAPRLTYRDGTLELLGSAPEQRQAARNAGRLLSAYAQQRLTPLKRRASWAIESPDGSIGVETEEAFVLGESVKDRPDFVFETRNPNAGNWLASYAAIGIQEVWIWRQGRIDIRKLDNGDYTAVARSSLLPDLDPTLLARHVMSEDQLAAVKDFTQALEQTAGNP